MGIVFGIGTGRCGTTSLAKLLNSQPDSVCFHEANPSGMAWAGAQATVTSLMNDFRVALDGGPRGMTIDWTEPSPERKETLERYESLDSLQLVGDVGFYYLPYVELILSLDDSVRFCCLRRDREQTVQSYVEWVRIKRWKRLAVADWLHDKIAATGFEPSRNHWVTPGDKRWRRDGKWDKCYPDFAPTDNIADAIGQYWDLYYQVAAELASRFPENVRIFDISALNHPAGREEILAFCGVADPAASEQFWMNQSKDRA